MPAEQNLNTEQFLSADETINISFDRRRVSIGGEEYAAISGVRRPGYRSAEIPFENGRLLRAEYRTGVRGREGHPDLTVDANGSSLSVPTTERGLGQMREWIRLHRDEMNMPEPHRLEKNRQRLGEIAQNPASVWVDEDDD